MKTFTIVAALLVASLGLSDASRGHHHHHRHHLHHHKSLRSAFKATPWDGTAATKASKCKDLCLLSSYWIQQKALACTKTSTACTNYTKGVPAVATVLSVAGCDCGVTVVASGGGIVGKDAPEDYQQWDQ